MADTNQPEPIEVSANQGTVDAIMAALRYIGFLVAAVVALAGFIGKRDAAGFMAYVQTNGGQIVAAVSGLIAVGLPVYGVIHTKLRGAQVATVAADPEVPDHVATLK